MLTMHCLGVSSQIFTSKRERNFCRSHRSNRIKNVFARSFYLPDVSDSETLTSDQPAIESKKFEI